MANEGMKYEEAMRQLEAIAAKMERDEFDLDEIAEQMKTAKRLIKMCKGKLTDAEGRISLDD